MTEHYSLQPEIGTDDELFMAIMDADDSAYSRLKENGAVISDKVKNVLSINRLSALQDEKALGEITCDFQCAVRRMNAKDFIKTIRALREEMGEPLFFMPAIWQDIKKIMFENGVWECVLDCFDNRMNKARTMRDIIKCGRADLLMICAEHGWLSQPKKRDEMIEYATENGKTECAAYLLDFKNRTADLAAERARAEKKAERELNAAPNSVTELKKIWRTKKLEDGTLEITCYNGRQTEVTVPEKIGKSIISSIGNRAFTGDRYAANRTPEEICEFRKDNITKITLPETIKNIGDGAFLSCEALKEVNIPSGVTVINSNTFANTAIDVIELPETVERLADYAFSAAHFKKIELPKSLVEIGKGALKKCDFERIEIPPKIKVINPETFWNCNNLKEVVLHEGIEEIRLRAFWFCTSLEKINLPASITKIENFKRGGKITSPFADNPKLTAVVDKGSYAEKYCKENKITYKYKEET